MKDNSDHLYSYIFKFHSPVARSHYIVKADYHNNDFFAIKFYPTFLKRSDYKYQIITNRGDLGNILVTCTRVIPILLKEKPLASFGFAGACSIDKKRMLVEGIKENQRFLSYCYFIENKIGSETFEHRKYKSISAYMIINRNTPNGVKAQEEILKKMLCETYNSLPLDMMGLDSE